MPEGKWIFDRASLSNFLLTDSTYLLEKRYAGCGIITREVYGELSSGMVAHPELRRVGRLIDARIFKLLSLSTVEHTHYVNLIGHLGKGEASCIALVKHQAAIVVTDDRAARRQCMQMSIQATGTIGILKASFLGGEITLAQADDILKRMMKSGFYSPVRNVSDIV